MHSQRRDGKTHYLNAMADLMSFLYAMDPIIAERCKRNTLMLSNWTNCSVPQQEENLIVKQGFKESFGLQNNQYVFHYKNRPENYSYRGMHLMLRAYDTYFYREDMLLAEQNRESKRLSELPPPEETTVEPDNTMTQIQSQTARLEVGLWGGKPKQADVDERQQQPSSSQQS
ncbi:MAG: hypothetical protein GY738_00740, partial [Pseudoalteromonas sp.]|nr:hypothetical protein [Pseudoalteromonas sp.]